MASSAFLLYESQQEIDSKTFYKLRVALVPNVLEDLISFLLFLIDNDVPLELSLLDLPILIPSTISSGTTLNNWSGTGSYTLTENIYFAYAKGQPNIHALKDIDTPDSDDIAIAQAFLGDCEVWYCDTAPGEINQWPTGDDPGTTLPDTNGWSYPDTLGDWGYVEVGDTAGRYLSPFFYTDVWVENVFLWAGCSPEDEDHFQNNSATSFLGNRWRYSDPNFIESCHEEDSGYIYWVERETIGSVETIAVWKFMSSDNAYYYPHLDFSDAIPSISPRMIHEMALDLLNLLDINTPAMQGGLWQLTQCSKLYATQRAKGLASGNTGLASGNTGVSTIL